jgi:4-hydroxybenzoate polyprenyltransferase
MRFFLPFYFLEIVGATVITTLGWVACQMLGLDWIRSGPLWFAGYLLVYNADRLYRDPADEFNTPLRFAWDARLRRWRRFLVLLAALALFTWPVVTGRLLLIATIAGAAFAIQFYSRPVPWIRRRWKDLPYVKSLVAPIVIAVALVLWPVLESRKIPDTRVWLVFLWVFLMLTMNSLVFDHRDIIGDRRTGTRTIPSFLGQRASQLLLILLAIALVWSSSTLYWFGIERGTLPWLLAIGCGALLLSVRKSVSPILLSFFADLLLLLPALAEFAIHFGRDDGLSMK